MPFKLGITEVIFILLVILIIFGVGKLPQIFGLFDKWKRDFKKNKDGNVEEVKKPRTKKVKE